MYGCKVSSATGGRTYNIPRLELGSGRLYRLRIDGSPEVSCIGIRRTKPTYYSKNI